MRISPRVDVGVDHQTFNDPEAIYGEVVAAFEEVALLTVSEAAELNDVLRLVGQRLCELLGVSRCSVYVRREDGRFQGQVGFCVGRRSIDAGISRLVSGVDHDLFTAEIVRSRAPVLVQNAAKDPRTIQRTMRQWGVRDMLGVPLVVDGQVTGIIYVDNQGEFHDYTPRDVKLAQAFAGLSALAVRQAGLYRQLGGRTRVIEEQRRVLGESAVVHDRVTRLVLDGAGMEEILALIVRLLGKPVVVYGPDLKPVTWSAPEQLKLTQSPAMTAVQVELAEVRRALEMLREGRSTVMIRATPDLRCRRLLVRMVVDQQCVGYLELCELGRPFRAADSKALGQAALAVSLKLLAVGQRAETHRQAHEAYLADILLGRRDAAWLASRAESFGFDLVSRHVVLRLQYDDEGTGNCHSIDHGTDLGIGRAISAENGTGNRVDTDCGSNTGDARRRLIVAYLSEVLADGVRWVAGTGVPGADLILIEVAADLDARLTASFAQLSRRFGVAFAVVSEPCRTLVQLPREAEKLREIVGLLRDARCEPRLVFGRELELVRLLSRRDGIQGAARHAADVLGPLREHDESGGALLGTLRAYIDSQAQIRGAAVRLGVHENTVRYRLKRVREMSIIDPDRLEDLMTAALALQVETLLGWGSRAN